MKKSIIIILLAALVLACTCHASEVLSNKTYLGVEGNLATNWSAFNSPSWYSFLGGGFMLTNPLTLIPTAIANYLFGAVQVAVQETNAGNGNSTSPQLSNSEIEYNLDKTELLKISSAAWDLVLGLFTLIYETIVLLVVFFEMRIILWVLLEAIPQMFIYFRNSVTDAIIRREKR